MPTQLVSNRIKTPLHMEKQSGWTCQLYAMAGVMHWLYENHLLTEEPLPARKRDKDGARSSLRAFAKKMFHSSAGEMNTTQDILDLAKVHPEICVSGVALHNEKDYCQFLTDAIDCNLAPIIFYEVDTRSGKPMANKSENDHAAVVIGYQRDEADKLSFTLMQWQKEFVVAADDLFKSTNQIPSGRKAITTFLKTENREEKTAWYPSNQLYRYFSHPKILGAREAVSDIRENDFRNMVIVIDVIHKIRSFIDMLSKRKELSTNDPVKNAVVKRNIEKLKYSLKHNEKMEALYVIIQRWKNSLADYNGLTNEKLLETVGLSNKFNSLYMRTESVTKDVLLVPEMAKSKKNI